MASTTRWWVAGVLCLIACTDRASAPPAWSPTRALRFDISDEAIWTVIGGPSSYTELGSDVAFAGDVNADGFGDVVLSAPDWVVGGVELGSVAIYHGSASGLGSLPDAVVYGDQDNGNFGVDIDGAGDVNGDGYDDILVGANSHEPFGGASVFLGSATGVVPIPAWATEADQSANYGNAVSFAGDTNGDGFTEVSVGAENYDTGEALLRGAGRAYVYDGSAGGPDDVAGWIGEDGWDPEWSDYGSSLAAGDVNGDGFDDLIVGSAGEAVHVYAGSSAGPSDEADWMLEPEGVDAAAYASAVTTADVNGDGYDDVVVGSSSFDDDVEQRLYVFHGSATGPDPDAPWILLAPPDAYSFAWSLAGRDLDGDGHDEVIVGGGETYYVGKVWVYRGSAEGLGTTALCSATGGDDDDFGDAVAFVDNVDGQGRVDLLVGAHRYDAGVGMYWVGRVDLFPGGLCVDTDGDGVLNDTDLCDGDDASGDADGDLFCASATGGAVEDCDEADATVFPGAIELCDGKDNACSGAVPLDEQDVDADGIRTCDGDCDDTDPTSWPGAPELCDGADNTCAGAVPPDESDVDLDGFRICDGDCNDHFTTDFPGAPELCDGIDNSCFGSLAADEVDADGDGLWPCQGDCDDAHPGSYFGAPEICDGAHNDCTGPFPADETDEDGDGFLPCDGDCDDADPAAWPGAPERCDGADNACAGVVPAGESDVDQDGAFPCNGDCDDRDPRVAAPFAETCDDHLDNNCDGRVDEGCDVAPPPSAGNGCQTGRPVPDVAFAALVALALLTRRRRGLTDLVVLRAAPPALLTLAWDQGSFEQDSLFGYSVASAGDVNGDGYGDVVIGAPDPLVYQVETGAAALWLGGSNGLAAAAPAWKVDGSDVQSPCGQMWYGLRVAAAGDVDGDGFDDVAVGSDDWAGVYAGSAAGLDDDTFFVEGIGSCLSKYGIYLGFGWVIASPGDVNGDGYDDLAMGLENYGVVQGAALLHYGSPFGLALVYEWSVIHDEWYASYGGELGGADVNGDGYDDLIVGAAGVGKVLVYHGSAGGLSTVPSRTIDVDSPPQFGWSLAGAGDVNADGYEDIVVSALPSDGSDGAVFVFHGGHDGLDGAAATVLTLPSQPDASFGHHVAGAGDIDADGFDDIAIGAPTASDVAQEEGAVFVHRGSPTGIQAIAAWSASPTDQDDAGFGGSVASAGDVNGDGYGDLVVGAPYYDSGPREDEGRAYVFTGAALPCEGDPISGDADGDGVCRLDLGGAIADCDDGDPTVWPGAEEQCDGRDTSCAGELADNERDADLDGVMACAGDCDDADPATHPGATQTCDGADNTCAGSVPLDEIDADLDGWIACAGDCDDTKSFARPDIAEICGDLYDNDCDGAADEACAEGASGGDEGCSGCAMPRRASTSAAWFAFVALLLVARRRVALVGLAASPMTALGGDLIVDPTWVLESTVYSAQFGTVAASAGDVNGDGFFDVLVGVPSSAPGGIVWQDYGAVSVFVGSADGLSPTPAWTVQDDEVGTGFGTVAASAGDVDADGFDDVVLAAVDPDTDHLTARLYLGSSSGPDLTPAWTAEGELELVSSHSVATAAGDVNGDGFGDLLFREDAYFTVDPEVVRAYHGTSTGAESNPAWTTEPGQAYSQFGQEASSAGDVNGDGYGDVVVGAPGYSDPEEGEGAAFVYLGSAAGLAVDVAWSAQSDQARATFGESVAGAGDVDGDGYDDVVVGAPYWDGPEIDEGRVLLFRGDPTGLETEATFVLESDETSTELGLRVRAGGDVDGEGGRDVVFVGGAAFVHLGAPTGVELDPACVLDYGAVAPAGDIDGDGYDDIVAGDPEFDGVEANVGAVYAFSGARCVDLDGDGVANADDLCIGIDGSGDGDGDGICATGTDIAAGDCDDTDPNVFPGADEDCDGKDTSCNGLMLAEELDEDGDGSFVCNGDCDDFDPTVFPAAPEICDRVDNVCAGELPPDEIDLDRDGFTPCEGDCADHDPETFPGAFELCDGIDNACAGAIPLDEIDQDLDGVRACSGDCDDSDPATFPGATEVCDGAVNDCVGVLRADERDEDGDGFVPCGGDCDDSDASSWPGAPEVCDGADNACRGAVPGDEADRDGDGVSTCDGDCDDARAYVAPGHPEECGDDLDNDCDGAVNESCEGETPSSEGGGCRVAGGAGAGGPLALLAFLLSSQATRRGRRGLGRPPCTPSSWRSTSRSACSSSP